LTRFYDLLSISFQSSLVWGLAEILSAGRTKWTLFAFRPREVGMSCCFLHGRARRGAEPWSQLEEMEVGLSATCVSPASGNREGSGTRQHQWGREPQCR